jgi:uncharacterized protein YjiS (DUF1127 family)
MMEKTMTATTALRTARPSRSRLTARGVLDFFAALDARHRERHYLRIMDDRLLRDIGATRADVEAEFRNSIW